MRARGISRVPCLCQILLLRLFFSPPTTFKADHFTHLGGSEDECNYVQANEDKSDHTNSRTDESDDTINLDKRSLDHDIPRPWGRRWRVPCSARIANPHSFILNISLPLRDIDELRSNCSPWAQSAIAKHQSRTIPSPHRRLEAALQWLLKKLGKTASPCKTELHR